MENRFERCEYLYGKDGMSRLASSRVAIFGVGGVGGYVVEGLARSGIGSLDLIDGDKVALTNINRQIIALTENIGELKVEVAKKRVQSINPDCKVNIYPVFFTPSNSDEFDFSNYDYIVDAIDSVPDKIAIIKSAKEAGVRIISAMGAGNKLDPTQLEIADIYKTSVCPLARKMRHELKKIGVEKLTVVYSKEEPAISDKLGSTAFVPPTAGLLIASKIVKDLLAD